MDITADLQKICPNGAKTIVIDGKEFLFVEDTYELFQAIKAQSDGHLYTPFMEGPWLDFFENVRPHHGDHSSAHTGDCSLLVDQERFVLRGDEVTQYWVCLTCVKVFEPCEIPL